ncbi:MAG: hypothetical protein ACREIV_01680, partial [Planctomycetaceae bacterium]
AITREKPEPKKPKPGFFPPERGGTGTIDGDTKAVPDAPSKVNGTQVPHKYRDADKIPLDDRDTDITPHDN